MTQRNKNLQKILDFFHLQRKVIIHKIIQEVSESRGKICLTPSQWPLIMFLEHNQASSIKELAKTFGITSSAATQLVDGLVQNKYVQRKNDSNDRRRILLSLTSKAKQDLKEIQKKTEKFFISIFSNLSEKELESYVKINQKITDTLLKKS